MSLQKLSQSNISKSVLLVLAVATLFLGGPRKVEAAAVTWGIWYESCFGYSTTAITGGWMDDGFGNPQYITYSEPLFSTTFGLLTLTELSNYFQQYPIDKPGTIYYYEIMTSDGSVQASFPNSACKMYESTQYFAAKTEKEVDTYVSGEPITISIGANATGGFQVGDWSFLTTSILWNALTAPISCFIFGGCEPPPYVGLQAKLNNGPVVAGWCGGDGSTSCSGTINTPSAPLAKGDYTFNLEGCYQNCPPAAPIGTASIPFTITAPPPICPVDAPYIESNSATIASYCASQGVTCGVSQHYVTSLSCHTAYGPSCAAPNKCGGCACVSLNFN